MPDQDDSKQVPPSQDDLDLFQQMMGDVTPLAQDVTQLQKKHHTSESQLAKQAAAIYLTDKAADNLSIEHAPQLQPNSIIEFKKNGVQEGVYRKLRLGKYPIQAKLDLHRKTLKQAKEAVLHFLKQCMTMDIRTVLIVHGKGERSNPPAQMKSFIGHWLKQINEVQCVHSAQVFHGGSGAVYVLLRKSANKKLETREHHQKRMS